MSNQSKSRSSSPENNIFNISTNLIPIRETKSAGIKSIDFDHILNPPLLLHEDLQPGCGGQLWPAGLVLSKYLLQHELSSLAKGRNITELGAGVGLVGLSVSLGLNQSRKGSHTINNPKIIITDQAVLMPLMSKNILLNNLSDSVTAKIYNWGEDPPTTLGQVHPDTILAADCVYFEPAFPLLLQTLNDLIGPSTTCWFCFKKRRKADLRFIRDLKKRFTVVDVDYYDEDMKREGVWLYRVTLKGH